MKESKITIEDVMNVLGVYEESAKELLDGSIPFEAHELLAIAEYKGVAISELVRFIE